MSAKIYDLPDSLKYYNVKMSDGSSFPISATEKIGLLNAKGQYVELATGEIINKSFIVTIKLNKEKTQQEWFKLPLDERKPIIDKINTDLESKILPDYSSPVSGISGYQKLLEGKGL